MRLEPLLNGVDVSTSHRPTGEIRGHVHYWKLTDPLLNVLRRRAEWDVRERIS